MGSVHELARAKMQQAREWDERLTRLDRANGRAFQEYAQDIRENVAAKVAREAYEARMAAREAKGCGSTRRKRAS